MPNWSATSGPTARLAGLLSSGAPDQNVALRLTPEGARDAWPAHEVAARVKKAGLRLSVDDGSDRMNAKIRNAQKLKVPYMLVIGDRERDNGLIAVRTRGGEDLGSMTISDFVARIAAEPAAA